MQVYWGDLPTWIASLGTVGALAAALWQIGNERRRRIAQESQARQEDRRSQARHVAAWFAALESSSPTTPYNISLINGSEEPVYCVFVCAVYIQGAAPTTTEEWLKLDALRHVVPVAMLSIIPPGRWAVQLRQYLDPPMQGRLGAEVAFSDRSGVHWVRRAMGNLEELPRSPTEYFSGLGLNPPYDWTTPKADPP